MRGVVCDAQTYIDQSPFEQVWMGKSHRKNFYRLLWSILEGGLDGDIVELGCGYGGTSALIMHALHDAHSDKLFHVYDSFEGMPEPCNLDEPGKNMLKKGDIHIFLDEFYNNLRRFAPDCPLPIVHRGWFKETLKELPEKVCFAFLDSDFYESISLSLEYVYPRLTQGAVVIIDDYGHPRIPGVAKAVDHFFKGKNELPELVKPDPSYVLDPLKPQCVVIKGDRTQYELDGSRRDWWRNYMRWFGARVR